MNFGICNYGKKLILLNCRNLIEHTFLLPFFKRLNLNKNSKMFKSKSNWACSYCSKIYQDPIILPCNHSICREHLSEKTVVKENKVICKECNKEFGVNENEFESNYALVKLTESQSYLSDEEKSLKQELEGSCLSFFQFYEEFIQNKIQLESHVFEHFQEMRFQIDQHREELKKKIDDIALDMIRNTEKYEKIYLASLKDKVTENNFSSTFDHRQSLANELNQIEDKFRNPNLLIETIKEMQRKLEASLNEIQLKLRVT